MASAVFEHIKALDALPSPSRTVLEIVRLADDQNACTSDVAKILESDPAIAGRLLRIVNSPLAGFTRRICSLPHAISLLGMQAVKSVTLGFAVMNERPSQCMAFDHDRFCSESVVRAVSARRVAALTACFAPDEAFGFGLLCQVGRLALASTFGEAYSDVLADAQNGEARDLSKLEQAAFGIDHNELSAELLADWNMPSICCDAVRCQDAAGDGRLKHHSREQILARILHFTGHVWSLFSWPEVGGSAIGKLINATTRIGIDPNSVYEMFDSICDEWESYGSVLSVKTYKIPSLSKMCASIP